MGERITEEEPGEGLEGRREPAILPASPQSTPLALLPIYRCMGFLDSHSFSPTAGLCFQEHVSGLWAGVGTGRAASWETEGRLEGLKGAVAFSLPTHCSPLCPQVGPSRMEHKLKT